MKKKKESWLNALFSYAKGQKSKFILSMILSVCSILAGLMPFFCMYRMICLFAENAATGKAILGWCLAAFGFYAAKVILYGLSTGTSHYVAYHVLEGLRLQVADRFLHAPLGEVQSHTIGEIKNIMVDKIENIEPPLAHMAPEGALRPLPLSTGGSPLLP